jgi:hypothetical protein
MYYPLLTNQTTMTAMDSCNAAGEEQLAGLMMGLDNDGDNLYDTADPDCACGDGVIDPGEACDDGAANGTTECGCQLDCQYATSGTACGDPSADECDLADTCDGAGSCDPNLEPDGTACGDPLSDQCDNPDSCLSGVCEPNYEPAITVCDDGLFCTLTDTCDGNGLCEGGTDSPCLPDETCQEPDTCIPPTGDCGNGVLDPGEACDEGAANGTTECDCQLNCQYATLGTACGDPSDTECDAADSCDGSGACLDNLEPIGTACGDPSDTECDAADSCDGSGTCLDNLEPIGTACGDPSNTDCDNPDSCDGVGTCEVNNEPDGTACGDPSNTDCTNPDTCLTGACDPNDEPAGTACTDGLFCTDPDTCDGAGLCDGPSPCQPGEICNEDLDICEASEGPPPVRQNIGIPDSSIADLTEAECRFCHEDPNIVDDANIPNRHHNLVGTPVADPTIRPFPDGDTNGNYDCYSCHALVWDGTAFVLETFRDCIFCHNTGSPHHTTAAAQAQLCDTCHGPVNNPFDGHQIPTTIPSLVTPEPSGGEGLPLNSLGNGAGACNYCHDSGLEPESGILVDTNMNLHHNTGLFDTPGDCSWCHKNGNPFSTDADRIRTCERCHGFESLHNIQADSNGDDQIIPNGEDPYWGHIGSNDDCWGCHGFAGSAAPGTGAINPHVELLSQYSVTTGTDTTITLTGVALTNTIDTAEGPVTMDSQVVLTADDGSTVTLVTTAISGSSMDVVVPAALTAGNYTLRAVKDSNDSNAIGLAVIPAVTIADSSCSKKKGVLTINGSGFGTKPEGTDADINVLVNDQPVNIIAWSDTLIKADVSSCPKRATVTVNALFGSDTSSGGGGGNGKPDKPCKKNC